MDPLSENRGIVTQPQLKGHEKGNRGVRVGSGPRGVERAGGGSCGDVKGRERVKEGA